MKKLLSILVLSVIVMAPLGVKAARIDGNCEKSCPTGDGKCTSVCTLKVKDNTSALTEFKGELEFGKGVTIKSVTPGEGWTNLNGNNPSLSFMATSGNISAKDFTLATVTIELESASTDCTIKLKNPSIGVEVTIPDPKPENPSTGAALPIAIIAGGAVVAGAIYVATRKNKKLYKI